MPAPLRFFALSLVCLASLALAANGCQVLSGVTQLEFGSAGAGGTPIPPSNHGGSGGAGGSGGGDAGAGGSGPIACMAPADCPKPDKPCVKAICVSQLCGSDYIGNGDLAPDSAQITGDCALFLCDGEGNTKKQADQNDLPNDDSECTDDSCFDVFPLHAPRPFATPCGLDATSKCNNAGECVQCLSTSDCGPPSECVTPSCENGSCTFTYSPVDTPLAVQQVGDCKSFVCDGNGMTVEKNDDQDTPDDGIDCTDDVCTNGVASNPPKGAGSACGQQLDLTCDADGNCTGCTAATDCAGIDSFCRTRVCTASVCGFDKQPGEQLPPADQVQADCLAKICSAFGTEMLVADDTDVPADDGNACTAPACNDGQPLHLPEPLATPCAESGGTVCDGSGSCVACVADGDCPKLAAAPCTTDACVANKCDIKNSPAGQPAPDSVQVLEDCLVKLCDGNGGYADQPALLDVPSDGNDCTKDVCKDGVPSHPLEPSGTACQSMDGGQTCDNNGICVQCLTDLDCGTGTCLANECSCPLKSCVDLGATCGVLDDGCGGKVSCNNQSKDGFETDVDCGGDVSQCATRCANGKICSGDLDCTSNACSQGLCCNSACTQTCSSCASADTGGVDGTCGFVKKGLDPALQCGANQTCDGQGTCKSKAGVPCTTASQCVSGACIDGFCCDQPCTGSCEACSKLKNGVADGMCLDLPLAADPDNECNAATPICSGTGNCASCGATLPPPGGLCPGQCTGGCNLVTNQCTIKCDAAAKGCSGLNIACPDGWDCLVKCGKSLGCEKAKIACPNDHACTLECTGSNQNEFACKEAELHCKNGKCGINCKGNDTKDSCTNAKVVCGSNACAATCDAIYDDPAKYPTLVAKGACSCNSCGAAGCQ